MKLRYLLCALILVLPAYAYSADLFVAVPESAAMANASQKSLLNSIKLRQTTKSVNVVRINRNLFAQNAFELNLRPDFKVRADVKSVEKRTENDFTVFGKLANLPGDAVLVVRGNDVTGTINTGTQVYRIKPLGSGLHALILVDRSKLPQEHPPAFKEREMRKINTNKLELYKRLRPHVVAKPVISLIVAYTPAAKSAYGDNSANGDGIKAMIQLAVSETNQGYLNSGINASVRLAHTYQVNYNETSRSYDTILAHFSGKSDGFMDDIHGLRNSKAADVAVLIINQSAYCGLADDIMATVDSAFALVHYDCATGYYSFGHEIGHLLGARHNHETDNSVEPFAHGHGCRNGNEWRTIMAYNCPVADGCPRLNYWSNPNVRYNNVPMGTAATHDNARVLNSTAGTIAAFKSLLLRPAVFRQIPVK